MLKFAVPIILAFLAILFNNILETQKYPGVWSISIITNILRSGGVANSDNYQRITITSWTGKLLSLLLTSRLTKYDNGKKLVNYNQARFQKSFHTADHFFTVRILQDKYWSKNWKLYFCFVDFRKECDSIWRKCLFQKLIYYGY